MTIKHIYKILTGLGLACACGGSVLAQTSVPSTYKHITIDGSFSDWTGVPLACTVPMGSATAIQYENVYVANDETNLYIRFTLYSPRANAFANPYDNIFIDADDNGGTGFAVGGIGSEMLVQWGGGYQETNSGFNIGNVNNLGWNIAGSADSTDFEVAISLGAVYAAGNTPVFDNGTVAIVLEGDNSSYQNTTFAPASGGLVYSFASASSVLTSDLSLISTSGSSWEYDASGTDFGTNWLDSAFDDSGWTTGDGLFGYTSTPGVYPAIQTSLPSGPNTYYFRTHFQWANDTAKVAFVVTNYLSDGAVYYINGTQVRSVRMPTNTITYATAATGTNSPAGHVGVFGVDGGTLVLGDNIFEVETHQAPASSADMVFGMSLTASIDYPLYIVRTNLPANQTILAGQPVTFTSDVIGSGALSYQWFFNGTNPIAGATGPSYSIPFVLTNNAGSYTLTVSNSSSNVITRTALLTVSNVPVVITSQLSNVVVVEGRPVTLSVGVSGTPIILYQWYFGGSPIAGATNSSYAIASATFANTGTYQVTISNPASTTNSSLVNLNVLVDTVPPNVTAIAASATQITVTFTEPLDAVTAANAAKYSVSGGITVVSAVQNPANAAQVTLTTGVGMSIGSVYTLTVNGVNDVYSNAAHVSAQFTRDITVDGSFDDWTGIAPLYTSSEPSGNTGAADFAAIYLFNDANYYYFRVSLWTDIDPGYGQFPYYVNMFFDTDNNPTTGYSAIGSEMLIQSGYNYQEKDGGFNDGFGINGLNWLCLPQAPGTNFEFQLSKSATFGQDGTPVFTTNVLNFVFQGMTPGFVVENTVPASGVLSYTEITPPTVPALPLGKLGISALAGGQAVVSWDPPGILQVSSSVTGTWTNLPTAVSPYAVPASGKKLFFRLTH